MDTNDRDSQVMNYLVRMVVPLRREFGRVLDVGHFLHDFAYAREVLDQALGSKDARLLEYARYVQDRLHGPRIADTPAAPRPGGPAAAAPAKGAAQAAAAADPTASPTAEELRARVMKKYTGGLR